MPVRPEFHPARKVTHSNRTKVMSNPLESVYLCSMAVHKGRILLIDENPIRLSSAATLLILSGYSVFALGCAELYVLLERGDYRWRIDLVLIRAVLDSAKEKLLLQQLGSVPVRRLFPAAVLDVNLPTMVDEFMARKHQLSA